MFKYVAIILALISLNIGTVSADDYSSYEPLSYEELINLTVTEAAEKIRSGETTSVELVRALIKRTRANKHLNAYTQLNKKKALRAAKRADLELRYYGPRGPLHGVPLALKDNIDVNGFKTTASTPALLKNKFRPNAPVTQSLLDAGAIIIGKTNMHELAFGITSDNFAFGPVRNPYNPLTIPGGSSGGTATAVSALMAPAGLGTDTGGSVRLPAALTGLFGFRPTVGRLSQEGIVPLSTTRDTAGPITRSMEDIILLDGVMSGGPTHLSPADLNTISLGVPRSYFYENLDTDVKNLMNDFLLQLESAGVRLVEADIPNIEQLNAGASFPVVFYEVLRALPEYLESTSPQIPFSKVVEQIASPDVQGAFAFALGADGKIGTADDAFSEQAYEEAITISRPALQQAYIDYFADYGVDAIIFPTAMLPARVLEGGGQLVDLNGEKVPAFNSYIRNVDPGSGAGIPGLSLPIGLTPTGLPVGIELDGLADSDQLLLEIGLAIEAIVDETPKPILR